MAGGSRDALSGELLRAFRTAGEVGRGLEAVDWRKTPLGEPHGWPSTLRTVLTVMLSSRFAMWLAWGPQLTFFCNESYRRDTLGAKYPSALGRPIREVWAEIWPDIGPRIEHVLRSGQATWDRSLLLFLERAGFEEETYHTFSYSPLTDARGETAGILCVVCEDTERVISERRTATLRDLGDLTLRDAGDLTLREGGDPQGAIADQGAFLRAAGAELERNPRSLPFTAIYTFDPHGNAHLACMSGLHTNDPRAPALISAADGQPVWPIRGLRAGEQELYELDDLEQRFPPLPTGVWIKPPTTALVLALTSAADTAPLGFLVVGVNPYRPLDGAYRTFLRLVARRLAAGVDSVRSYAAQRERARQLAELDHAKSAFFQSISHEFRTPLTVMLAPMQDALDERRELDLEEIGLVHRNARRLLKLVNTLLDFSRLEAGRLRAEFRPVDVAVLTAELAATFKEPCRQAGITLAIDAQPPGGRAYLDPDLWERVVLNLVSNAFKATLEGRIDVRLRGGRNTFVLSVRDTGPGITARERRRIFERFHRVRSANARTIEGAGIGLALVKEIVELHGGRITVKSGIGRGSKFSVMIPLGREHLPADHVREEPAQPPPDAGSLFADEALSWLDALPAGAAGSGEAAGGSGSGDAAGGSGGGEAEGGAAGARMQRATVLVVDDNPDLRRYLTRLLARFWNVQALSDGADALKLIRERPPDLLISDVMLAGISGIELLRELRSSPQTQQLPVIMLSAHADEEASIEGLKAGADDYMQKPFSGRELLARVRSRLELALVRSQATENIRAQRLLLEQTVRQLPVGVVLADARSGEVLIANTHVASIIGRPVTEAREISEQAASRLYLPDRRTQVGRQAPLARALRERAVIHDQQLAYLAPDGSWTELRVNAAPVINTERDGEVVAGVVVFQDVTKQARAERLLAAQKDVMAMIARGEPLEQTLTMIARAVERLSERGGLAAIQLLDPSGRRLFVGAAPSLPPQFNAAISGLEIGEGVGSCGTAAYRRETVVVTDIRTDPLWAGYRELAAAHRLRACWATPIVATDGRVAGTLAVYHHNPHEPSAESRQIVELLAHTTAVAIERGRDAQMRARQLSEMQTSLLPPALPAVPGLGVAATFQAGDRSLDVGGDFYDLFELGDGRSWGLVVGDVSGHGAQAAAVTALTRHSTWAYARQQLDPAQVLASVSDALLARGYGRYCTAVYGRLETADDAFRLQLAVGGHPPPILRRANGSVERVIAHGPLLGMSAAPSFPVNEVSLSAGDMLVLYTDGLIERNPRVSSEEALAGIVATLGDQTAELALSGLQSAALGPSPWQTRDDVAIMILRASGRADRIGAHVA